MSTTQKAAWYHERRWAAVLVISCLLATYCMASLALNSGSLLQYFVAIILLMVSINRLAHILIISFKRKAV